MILYKMQLVKYHGVNLPKPKDYNYILTADTGGCYAYKNKPSVTDSEYDNIVYSDDRIYLAMLDLEGMNWTDTLAEYDNQGNEVSTLKKGQIVYVCNIANPEYPTRLTWDDTDHHNRLLDDGLLFIKRDNACKLGLYLAKMITSSTQ